METYINFFRAAVLRILAIKCITWFHTSFARDSVSCGKLLAFLTDSFKHPSKEYLRSRLYYL